MQNLILEINISRHFELYLQLLNLFQVMFCSQRCRDDAMNRFHRTECSILIKAFKFMDEISEKYWLAIRLLLIVTKQGEELEMLMQHPVYKDPFSNVPSSVPTTFDSKDFAHMFSLVTHVDKRPAGSWDDKLEMAVGFLYILKSASFFETSHTKVWMYVKADTFIYIYCASHYMPSIPSRLRSNFSNFLENSWEISNFNCPSF